MLRYSDANNSDKFRLRSYNFWQNICLIFQVRPNKQTPIIINHIPQPPLHLTPKPLELDPYYHPFDQYRHPRPGLIPPAIIHPRQTHQVGETGFNEQDFNHRIKEIGLYFGLAMQGLIIIGLAFLLYRKKMFGAEEIIFTTGRNFLLG